MVAPPPPGESCSDKDFKFWFTKAIEPRKPSTGPVKPPKPLMLADLPKECKAVLAAAPKKAN